jgi:hypothetical protein
MGRYLPIKHPWVDSSQAPVYQVTFPASASDAKVLSYCRAIESWSTHVAHPVAWLMDLSRVEQVSAQQRAIIAKFMKGMEAFDRRCNKGTALILRSALMRGVATAIFWLYDPLFPHRTFAEPAEGRDWLHDTLREAGIEQFGAASDVPSLRPYELASLRPSSGSSTRPSGAADSAPPHDRAFGAAASGSSSAPPRERGSARPNQR